MRISRRSSGIAKRSRVSRFSVPHFALSITRFIGSALAGSTASPNTSLLHTRAGWLFLLGSFRRLPNATFLTFSANPICRLFVNCPTCYAVTLSIASPLFAPFDIWKKIWGFCRVILLLYLCTVFRKRQIIWTDGVADFFSVSRSEKGKSPKGKRALFYRWNSDSTKTVC